MLASPDPEIQALAVTGMLESAQPKKKKGGFSGFVGEYEKNPIYQRVLEMSKEQVATQQPVMTTPSRSVQTQTMQPPPSLHPAAQSPTAITQVGAPPPQPLSYKQNPAQPTGETTTVMRPRQLFRTPEEQIKQDALAKGRAETAVEQERDTALGISPAERKELERARVLRGTAGAVGQTYAEGEIVPDPASPTGFSQTLYLRANPQVQQRIPASAPTARSSRAVNTAEQVAMGLYGKPNEDPRAVLSRLTPQEMQNVRQELQRQEAQTAGSVTTARGQAEADVPLSTQQRYQAISGLQADWRKVEAPHREMERQIQLMQTGMNRFRQGDKIGGAQAVLVTFQKILDPTSVVRESEYARSPEGLSLMGRIEGYMGRLREGGAGIPDAELGGMLETARQFLAGMQGFNDAERKRITATAKEFGLDPNLILGTPTVGAAPPKPAALAPGKGPDAVVPGVFVDDNGNLTFK